MFCDGWLSCFSWKHSVLALSCRCVDHFTTWISFNVSNSDVVADSILVGLEFAVWFSDFSGIQYWQKHSVPGLKVDFYLLGLNFHQCLIATSDMHWLSEQHHLFCKNYVHESLKRRNNCKVQFTTFFGLNVSHSKNVVSPGTPSPFLETEKLVPTWSVWTRSGWVLATSSSPKSQQFTAKSHNQCLSGSLPVGKDFGRILATKNPSKTIPQLILWFKKRRPSNMQWKKYTQISSHFFRIESKPPNL